MNTAKSKHIKWRQLSKQLPFGSLFRLQISTKWTALFTRTPLPDFLSMFPALSLSFCVWLKNKFYSINTSSLSFGSGSVAQTRLRHQTPCVFKKSRKHGRSAFFAVYREVLLGWRVTWFFSE